jgi:soluble cytochrome b562
MRVHKVLPAGAAVLALGVVFFTAAQAGEREDIDKLADVAAKSPDDLQKKADAYAKNLDSLEDVMNLLKKRTKDGKGGYGIGPKPTGQMDDGIEARIQNYAKKAPTAADLKKQKDDLLQAMNRVKAVAAVGNAKTPTKKMGDKDPKDWKEYIEEMSKQADALGKAIESGDPKQVKDAASRLNGSCTNCHGKFRD